jgi:hypothetical protein
MRIGARATIFVLVCSACGGRASTSTAASGGPSGSVSAGSGSGSGSTTGTGSATGSVAGAGFGGGSSARATAGSGAGSSIGSTAGTGAAGSSGGSAGGADQAGCDGACGPVPEAHRPDDSECQMPAPPGTCQATGARVVSSCVSDAQCTNGTAGRCQQLTTNSEEYCGCTYDTCMTDTDCVPGETCACHGAPSTDGAGNTCVPGNCRVDSDCGPGGYCSPSYGGQSIKDCPVAGRGLQGYYCHTANDKCLNQSDCPNPFEESCAYSVAAGFWQCTPLPGGDDCTEHDE